MGVRFRFEDVSNPSSYTDYLMVEGYSADYGFRNPTKITLFSDIPSENGTLTITHIESSETYILNVGDSVVFTRVGANYLNYLHFSFTFVVASDCDDDSDCEKGEKCVDGECVPCEKLVDGKGLVTLWGVPRVSDGTIMSDGLPVDISSGVATVQLSNFDVCWIKCGKSVCNFDGSAPTELRF